jgi:thymidylate synthase (FAD)
MKIVQPYASLMDVPDRDAGIALLRKIEFCARISHRSEEAQTLDSWERLIQFVVMQHGDWSVVEHASVTVDMLVDRGITHEIVRHRLFSFTQESTRFVNYEKKMPPSFISPFEFYTHDTYSFEEESNLRRWMESIDKAEESYILLIKSGISPQIARSVFPNALASRIIVTGNLRNWRHLFIMRTTKESHPQMRQVTIPLLREFQSKIPLLFDDIEPLAKQSEGMKRAR